MARTCRNNRTLVALTSVLWVLLLLTTLACAVKKYQTVQITNVHLHDSGAGVVDAYVTVQEGGFLFISDCGDAQRITIPKAWVSGTKIQARHNRNRVYFRNPAGKEYACDLLGRKHAPLR
jgi:hypothetical protein